MNDALTVLDKATGILIYMLKPKLAIAKGEFLATLNDKNGPGWCDGFDKKPWDQLKARFQDTLAQWDAVNCQKKMEAYTEAAAALTFVRDVFGKTDGASDAVDHALVHKAKLAIGTLGLFLVLVPADGKPIESSKIQLRKAILAESKKLNDEKNCEDITHLHKLLPQQLRSKMDAAIKLKVV